MALLFIDSFDHYQTDDVLSKWTSNFIAVTISVGNGRCGTNCLYLNIYDDLVKGIPFGSNTGTIGHAFYYSSKMTLAHLNTHVVGFCDEAARSHVWMGRAPDGSLYVVHDGEVVGRTAPDLVRQDHWYFIEFQATIATDGGFVVRLNNAEVLAVSDINTIASGATPILRSIHFSCGSNQERFIDDLYVLDSTGPAPHNDFLGDCRVEYLRPRAPGTYQQWDLAGTASTHYGAVDDNTIPDQDGSYVEAKAPNLIDTNLYEPTGMPAGTIFGAQLGLYARKSEVGPRVIAPVVNGTVGPPHLGPSHDLYQYWMSVWPTNPATGLAWTVGEINAIEAGVKVVS